MDSSARDLPLWEFATPGPLRERLNGLAIAGAKTGTFSLVELDRALAVDPAERGKRWVLTGSNGAHLAVVETVELRILRIADVTWAQVDSEGESFTSVADWREGHERYWARFLDVIRTWSDDPGWSIGDATEVIYETFRVVERLPGASEARYPVVECSVPASDVELASADLYELGTVGIEELASSDAITDPRDDVTGADLVHLRAGFPSDELAVAAELALDRRWHPRFEVLLGDDWLDAWREHFEPHRIGRIVIVPAWRDDSELMGDPVLAGMGIGDIVLHLDPGRSFGTGAHPSTRLILGALQELDLVGARVLDVGCGSGVLAVAALLLGAAEAHGVDIDNAAVERTLRNAEANGVDARCTASSTPVSAGARGADEPGARRDVVVANILAPVLIEQAEAIAATVAADGVLILSGFLAEQAERVATAYDGMRVVGTRSEGAWVSLTLQRREASHLMPFQVS
jgi:ribosomal protein L11 methyltransferase